MADPLLEAFAITLDPERFPDPQMALSAERRAAVGAALQPLTWIFGGSPFSRGRPDEDGIEI